MAIIPQTFPLMTADAKETYGTMENYYKAYKAHNALKATMYNGSEASKRYHKNKKADAEQDIVTNLQVLLARGDLDEISTESLMADLNTTQRKAEAMMLVIVAMRTI